MRQPSNNGMQLAALPTTADPEAVEAVEKVIRA